MATALLIVHGLVAVALLGAITHQTLATWAPAYIGLVPCSAAFAPCRPPHSPTPSSCCTCSARRWARSSTSYSESTSGPGWSSRPLATPRTLRPQGACRRHRAALLPAYWVSWQRPRSDDRGRAARRPDLDPRRRRLVELSDGTCREQHHRLRVMTSSSLFHRFAFAYGTAFAVFT